MASPRLVAAAASTRRPADVIAIKILGRMARRRQLGYRNVLVPLSDLEQMIAVIGIRPAGSSKPVSA